MTLNIAPLPEPEAPPAPDGGLGALTTDRGNLPLDTVDVRASITGLAASIEVVQGFRNPFDVPLEATYIFPLPDRAAVTALRMEAADRVIDGVLKERAQARRDYDAAIAAGKRAAIAEEDRPDVFTMRVGNILPGERVTARLTLNQPLPYEQRPFGGPAAATFRFPLVVAPRYIPGTPLDEEQAGSGVAADTDAVPDASRISPPVLLPGFPNPVRLSITADIDPAGLELTGVRSSLHAVAEDSVDGRTTVRLYPGERLNRDFILLLGYAAASGGAGTSLTLTPDEDGAEGTFALTVLPSGEGTPRPRDIVLVLDRSGSMSGWKMVAARRAAARIVDTFTDADRFAVLSFDNVVERPRDLGAGLVAGTDRNRFRAVEHLASLDARGGTEMLSPLEEACGLLADAGGRDRVLVLITDGQVGNEDQILARLTPRLRGARVHTVGIDRAVNAGFLRRLADAGQGRFELVESEDRLDEAMEHIHHRIGAPLVTDLDVRPVDGLEFVPDTVAPRRIGALYPGVPLVVSGRFRGSPSGGVVVRGTASDGSSWERRVTGTETKAPAAGAIWARAHLRDLEDRYAVSGSFDLEKRIVATSLRFNVLCRFTAFVAVDSRVVAEGGDPHHVVQPVEPPDDWAVPPGGLALTQTGGLPPGAAWAVPPAPMMAAGYGAAPQGAPGGPPPQSAGFIEAERELFPPSRGSARARTGKSRLTPEAAAEFAKLLGELQAVASADRNGRRAFLLYTALPTLERLAQPLQDETLSWLVRALTSLKDAAWGGTSDARFDELWDKTLQVLGDIVQQKPEFERGRRRSFWKRPR
ncbi:VIT domain-containing protein [Actinomadura sp. SCN-SB]|uniref:VIT domain-containing protein n=1 Tax=Actinomadura sp. SCN-SB TaxID=3373092 RepID=UPI00374FDC21